MKLLEFKRTAPIFTITPNTQQLQALTEGDLLKLHGLGFANIVLHQGSAGAVASDGVTQTRVAPAVASSIADVTGAGDAAVAGLVFGLAEGLPLPAAARLGQHAAAIKLASSHSVAEGLSRDRLFRLAGLS